MSIKEKLKQVINEATSVLEARKQEKEAKIKESRELAPLLYKAKVDKIISTIPALVREELLYPKKQAYGEIKVCDLDFYTDLINRECGSAGPKPGSFGEYIFNRLVEEGFKPSCNWDLYDIFGYKKYWAWLSIYVGDVSKILES